MSRTDGNIEGAAGACSSAGSSQRSRTASRLSWLRGSAAGSLAGRLGSVVRSRVRRPRLPHTLLLIACAAALPLLWGCVAVVHPHFPFVFSVGHRHRPYRPHASYYCYDCHGYTYFDPYYDYCAHFGFRISWGPRTSLYRYYTRHHDTIRWKMRTYPKYKYKSDYRDRTHYRNPVDYEKWKKTEGRTYYSTKQTPTKQKTSDTGKSSSKTSGKSKTKEKSKTSGTSSTSSTKEKYRSD